MRAEAESAGRAEERRVLQLLGLARRAGRVVVGTRAVKDAAGRGEVAVVIVSADAAENALRRLRGLAELPGIEIVAFGTRDGLGRAVGREEAVVVGVCDRGLGQRIAGEAKRLRSQASSPPQNAAGGMQSLE